jgi:predicted HAD superfamily Cof-like phosphohydrolase
MKSPHQLRVEQFMRLAKQNVPDVVTMPSEADRYRMAKLVLEEAEELIKALGFEVYIDIADELTITGKYEPDLAQMIDGVIDLHWVSTAALCGAGIPDQPFLDEVFRSNMTKFIDGHRREDGKWCKGPSAKPPDIAGILDLLRVKPAILKEPVQ